MRRGSLAQACAAIAVVGMALLPAQVLAQSPTSGIAGVVRDTSGAVLPGVTVEAASPALIEKVRVVTTDAQGRYNIVDLRPGVYEVTFSLPGFSTVKRTGIELASGFTAPINIDLAVGALEETITVAGATPQVDTQSVRQMTAIRQESLQALPLGQASAANFVSLIPGMNDGGQRDVGGTGGHFDGNRATYGAFHGKKGLRTTFEGMRTQNSGSGAAPAYTINTHFVQEVVIETGGLTAEGSATGMAMNSIPKDGGNTFSYMFASRFMNEGMQSDNVTDALRLRGVTTRQKIESLHDVGGYVGGPIKRDKLWFYSGVRRWGFRKPVTGLYENATLGSFAYTPNLSRPVIFREQDSSYGGRISWQVSTKNKIGFFTDYQIIDRGPGIAASNASAPEAQVSQILRPSGILQGTWQSVQTNKLLFEAGAAWMIYHNHTPLAASVSENAISILEQSNNFRYNAPATYYSDRNWSDSNVVDRYVQRFGMSYITGSHAFKAGMQLEEGVIRGPVVRTTGPNGGALTYTFNQGVPVSLSMNDTPYVENATMNADLSLYVQDQWTLNRLTLSGGLRFEYWNASIPAQALQATRFLPARSFDKVTNVPNYKDLNPRLGASYDLFGNSRTALKFAAGRYNDLSGIYYTQTADPHRTSISSATRSWNDSLFGAGDPRSRNFAPDCNLNNFAANGECGAVNPAAFGTQNPNTVRFADDVLRGWHKRQYLWDISAEVQQQITDGISFSTGYYRNWDGNLRVLRNEAVTPADYNPYCITAPSDSRLPANVSGQQICGLYNINPSKFGQVRSLWLPSNNGEFGKGTQRFSDFFNVSTNIRLAGGIRIGGGIDGGRTITDNCFIVDNPQATTVIQITSGVGQRAVEQRFCRENMGFMANLQIKFNGTVPLPYGITASAAFQNLPGDPISANYTATAAQIEPTLGRPLAGGVRTVVIPILAPWTLFEDRPTQLDVRLSKSFRVGRGRVEATADIYNLLNGSTAFSPLGTFGPNWLRPGSIMQARMIQIGARANF